MPKVFICVKIYPPPCQLSDDRELCEVIRKVSKENILAHPAEYGPYGLWDPKYPKRNEPRPLDFSRKNYEAFLFQLDECLQDNDLQTEVNSLFSHKSTVKGGAVSRKGNSPPTEWASNKKMFEDVISHRDDVDSFVEHSYEALRKEKPFIIKDSIPYVRKWLDGLDLL
ncbi:MAG: hypothetical protein IH975_11025 [Nitrospinae bacterium]|nr:hypothetical protein [Nitrospinota bacterium]